MSADTPSTLLHTPLHALHLELGARMVPFAGYAMPVQYPAGVMAEHRQCRHEAALFDVSHMGQILLRGDGAAAALESLVPVDVVDLGMDRQRYGFFTNARGGLLDDLMITRREDGLLVIDYPRRTLSFSRTLALSPSAPGALPYERAFRVPVAIGDLQVEGNLDTGANVAFVLPQALFDRVGGKAPRDAGGGQLANTRIDTQSSIVAGPFRIGDATLRDVEVRISDRYPELLVGAGALQDSVVLIDQRSQAVAVCPE